MDAFYSIFPFSFQTISELPPFYPPTNIQIRGYDFAILESYQRYVHKLCDNMGIEVTERWGKLILEAMPVKCVTTTLSSLLAGPLLAEN